MPAVWGKKDVCWGLATGGCGSCCQGTGLPLCRASLGPDFLLGGPRWPTPVLQGQLRSPHGPSYDWAWGGSWKRFLFARKRQGLRVV